MKKVLHNIDLYPYRLYKVKFLDEDNKETSLNVVIKDVVVEDDVEYLVLANGKVLSSKQIVEISSVLLPQSAKTAPNTALSIDEISNFQLSKTAQHEKRPAMV